VLASSRRRIWHTDGLREEVSVEVHSVSIQLGHPEKVRDPEMIGTG